jgi:hypothetical protein
LHAHRTSVYYEVERTYVTDEEGRSSPQLQLAPMLLPADNAPGAVTAFVAADGTVALIGNVTPLAGDKAVATLMKGSRVMVIFVQRAAEAVGGRRDRELDPRAGPRSTA